ncbi:SpaA isopeptide-forming pilin-related protein [Vagococcus lutrae]|uniref:SpaA isopeptide-forming pilin-related protein n=1 Tax=Vagococcus lutrae TaxID=81947 RepID=UPI00200BE61E|nr:SpaA isopeptide-forming pilin-related protein [Vagococcus lutrae]UQF70686.1 SpaA isopeptide-forming pilin-related protein [Vagococcus lutrae]
MRKITSWIVMIFVVLSQLIPTAQVILAEDNQVFFTINENFNRDNNASNLELRKNKEIEIDRVEITFDKSIEYFANLSTIQHATTTVDTAQNKLILTNLDEEFGDFNLFVKPTSNEAANILVEGFKDNQKIKSQNYLLVNREQNKEAIDQPVEKAVVISEERTAIQPRVGDLNTDIRLKAINDKIESGSTAQFKLTVKLTGSKKEYNNAKLAVKLPVDEYTTFNSDQLDDLAIANVFPVYDPETGVLAYDFSTVEEGILKSGQTYEKVLRLETKYGETPNNHLLEAEAVFAADNQEPLLDQSQVTIKASKSISVSKQSLRYELNKKRTHVPIIGGEVLWEVKISIPKRDKGQLYLKENSNIEIKDRLPKGLTFSRMVSPTNMQPTVENNVLTWQVKVPTIEEQDNAKDEFYEETLQFWTTIAKDKKIADQTLENIVEVDAIFNDGNKITPTPSAKSSIVPAVSNPDTNDQKGSWYPPYHYGPKDGKGKYSKSTKEEGGLNPNPTVSDDAWLTFGHNITSMEEGRFSDFRKYSTNYYIDKNLKLEEIITPGPWHYRPNSKYPSGNSLDKDPIYSIYGVVNGKRKELVKNADHATKYTRKDLGLKPEDNVSSISLDFSYAPEGMYTTPTNMVKYSFSVKKGYQGKVMNQFDVKYTASDGKSYSYPEKLTSDTTETYGARTALIKNSTKNQKKISSVEVSLLDHTGQEVVSGSNRMRVKIKNHSTSISMMREPIASYVLLPQGVVLDENVDAHFRDSDDPNTSGKYEIVSNNHKNSGRQLVKIAWDADYIRVGEELSADLNVKIAKDAPTKIQFDVYGVSGDSKLEVPQVTSPTITDTVLVTGQETTLDIGKNKQPMIKSGNIYHIAGQYDLQSEKFIKKSDETEWSKATQKILPGEKIDYQLVMTNQTNHTFESMILMDVLPSVGDIGLTDNINRGSHFTPYLTGPVSLPSEWKDKVDVFYSQSKNPKKDELTKNTKYPEGTAQLTNPPGAENPNWLTKDEVNEWRTIHSFKIEMKPSVSFLPGENVNVTYQVIAPTLEEILTGGAEVLNSEEISLDISNETAYVMDKTYRLPNIVSKYVPNSNRIASNSFAIATDHGQPVEPRHVDFYMEIDTKVRIKKIDKETKTALSGAEFELLDHEDNKIAVSRELISNDSGEIVIEDLRPGKYKLKEIKAPQGYNLLGKSVEFEVKTTERETQVVIENTKQGWFLPETGGVGTLIFYATGLLVMGISGAILISRKRIK